MAICTLCQGQIASLKHSSSLMGSTDPRPPLILPANRDESRGGIARKEVLALLSRYWILSYVYPAGAKYCTRVHKAYCDATTIRPQASLAGLVRGRNG